MDDDAVRCVIREQYGIISRGQALGAGMTRRQIERRVATREWEPVERGVYRHCLTVPSWRGRLLTACLRFGGLASHRSAGVLQGVWPAMPGLVEVTVAHGTWRASSRTLLHQATQLDLADKMSIGNIPCTGLARTMLDLAAVVDRRRLDRSIDVVLRDRRLEVSDLWRVLIRHSRQGRDGCGRLRSALDERRHETRVPLSEWSRLVAQLLVVHGLPTPELEHRVPDGRGELLAQVDLAYPSARLAIELDSVSWHLDRASFVDDRRRWNALTVAGWTVVMFTWSDFVDHPVALCATVRSALRR